MKKYLLVIMALAGVLAAAQAGGTQRAAAEEQKARLIDYSTVFTKTINGDLPDQEFLVTVASDTWGYFRDIVDRETGLPLDNIVVSSSTVKVNSYTSTTNIGLYLMAVVAGYDLNFVDRDEAVRRIKLTLNSLRQLDTWDGQYYNYYETDTLNRSSCYISVVDNGWLAAGLIVAKQAFPEDVRAGCDEIMEKMDFSRFYQEDVGQFSLGYEEDKEKYSPYHYGVFVTEPRVASYIAIAKGDVPEEHWFRLYRTLPKEWSWQQQEPTGKEREYLGYKVFEGYYRYKEFMYVPSWGGSMFEFLMPGLVLNEQELAPDGLGLNNKVAVDAQIYYATEEAKYPVWGISPCSKPEDPNGYSEYGVKFLGSQGYDDKNVVTPHASVLAVDIRPKEVVNNLRELLKFSNMYGQYGFYDSVNVKTGKVNTKYLCLDQAMILLALDNYLKDGAIRRRFHQEPMIKDSEYLLTIEKFDKLSKRG